MSTGWDGYYDQQGRIPDTRPQRVLPGWYPDPEDAVNHERWWSGHAWTANTRPNLATLNQTQRVQTVKVKPQKVVDRGLSPAAHTFWIVTTIATFGVGGFGWFLHWLFRQIVPRHVRTIR